DLPVLVPDHAALGEDVWPVAHSSERSRDDLFRVAQTVDSSGVDPVDAGIQGLADGGDGVAVVLGSPGELPARAADGPRPEADRCNEQVRVSELSCVHGFIPLSTTDSVEHVTGRNARFRSLPTQGPCQIAPRRRHAGGFAYDS